MAKQAVLLVNLGSPDSTSVADVRRYLDEFLSDDRVIDKPKPVQQFVLKAFILPKRPKASAHAYASIWTPEGSPLIVTSRNLQRLVQEQVARHGAHRGEHALVADAALGAQALDHAVAGALRGHAQALGLGLEVEAWGHAPPFRLSPRPPTQLATFSSAW